MKAIPKNLHSHESDTPRRLLGLLGVGTIFEEVSRIGLGVIATTTGPIVGLAEHHA